MVGRGKGRPGVTSQQPGPPATPEPQGHCPTHLGVLGCEREVLLAFATEISGRDEHAYTLPCPVPTVTDTNMYNRTEK